LHGGTHGPVVRVGDTVRREPRPSTQAIHALLRHLEFKGFDGAPKALGFDKQGREVLSFIPGDAAGQRGTGTPPAYVREVSTLVDIARLLRRYHDATAGFVAPHDAIWAFQVGAPHHGEVICHNDIGPWNVVFSDGQPIALIDFDTAAPGPRDWDIAYALYRFVPYVPDEVCTIIGWTRPPDRPARLRAFCEAYGLADWSHILEVMVRRIEVMVATGMAAHEAGDPIHGDEWLRVMKPRLLRDMAFIRAQ
jgi:aminoglycoside phosphotransferase (APT) family kinase protein